VNEKLVEVLFAKILVEGLGMDLNDPNLIDTPARIAKMYCRELFSATRTEYDNFKSFPNDKGYSQIIVSDRIFFVSTCSHHFLPFSGLAWVLYIPDKLLVGASKMARLVEHYARRPQLQENLCHDVLHRFVQALGPLGAMVVMRAEHGCMKCRGVRQYSGASMITSAVDGLFLTDPSVKQEGLELVKLSLLDGRG
jgi:GTP cyclohydrolase IA